MSFVKKARKTFMLEWAARLYRSLFSDMRQDVEHEAFPLLMLCKTQHAMMVCACVSSEYYGISFRICHLHQNTLKCAINVILPAMPIEILSKPDNEMHLVIMSSFSQQKWMGFKPVLRHRCMAWLYPWLHYAFKHVCAKCTSYCMLTHVIV